VEENGLRGVYEETYTDPKTRDTIENGVHNLTNVKDYFERRIVSLMKACFDSIGVTKYVDFKPGNIDSNYSQPDFMAALGTYYTQFSKYPYVRTTLSCSV